MDGKTSWKIDKKYINANNILDENRLNIISYLELYLSKQYSNKVTKLRWVSLNKRWCIKKKYYNKCCGIFLLWNKPLRKPFYVHFNSKTISQLCFPFWVNIQDGPWNGKIVPFWIILKKKSRERERMRG